MTATIKAAHSTNTGGASGSHRIKKGLRGRSEGAHISVESERDLLRAKVDDIQAVMLLRATDAAAAQARATEQEEALHWSLARLKTSDVTIES